MKNIELEIWIGDCFTYKYSDAIIEIYHQKPFIPTGDFGESINSNEFKSFHSAGTYVQDWIDILKCLDVGSKRLKATIHLNIGSNKKVFYDQEIVDVIDNIGRNINYKGLREFPI
jgi:hypothetical protein